MSRSSRQKRNQQYAVSLFPFLAVLVCTLGVLIVMLVMAVQAADMESQQRHDEVAQQQQQQLKAAQERRGLAEFESEAILSVRGELTDRLKVAKSDRSYLEQQIKDTNRQAEDLLEAIANLRSLLKAGSTKASGARSQPDADEKVEGLKSEIAAAQDSLKRLREEQSFQRQDEFAIVPFMGSGGTHRQPIFIECVRDAIVLQPYGIGLNLADFTQPLAIGNMLDSALLTVREYWERHGLADDDSKPYPLLVVRPDGAESYGLARRAMKSWDDEFGYELVDDRTKLQFGQPDLQLKSEIETAIETAKRRQQRLARQRMINQDDRSIDSLTLARGLKPSASGGFEFAATGQPAHELLAESEFESTGESGGESEFERHHGSHAGSHFHRERGSSSGEPFSQASYDIPETDSEFRNRYRGKQSSAMKTASTDFNSSGAATQDNQAPNASHSNQTGNASVANVASSSLANSRGSNWALPAQTTGARAYIRPIRLVCRTDQIQIISQKRVAATIPLHSQTVASIDPLVSEVWKTIEAWGLAGRQAYWKPELRFSVAPGAERQFQELRTLLDDSGLLVEMAHER